MQENIITGLDIGSRSVRMATGQLIMAGEKERLHILGAMEVPSAGINRGNIVNIEDVISTISICRERLERLINLSVDRVWVSVNNSQILCQASKGLVSVLKPNGEIGPEDVERAVEQARTIAPPPNYEILHVMARGFSVDGQPNVKDPIGMTGIRLEVDTLLTLMPSNYLKNLSKCIYRTGLNIEDMVLGIFANAENVLTHRQKEVGAAVINIGAATTSLAVFEEGDLVHVATLPIGSDYITQDVNLCFKISLETAERLKTKYGSANPRNVSKKEEINLFEEGYKEEEIISRKALSEIVEARVEEIFFKVNGEMKKIGRYALLPAGAILCGGGAKLEGIVDIAKKELKLPVTIGYPLNTSSVSEKLNDPAFNTAIGLVKWGGELQVSSADIFDRTMKGVNKFAGKAMDILKGGFKNIWR